MITPAALVLAVAVAGGGGTTPPPAPTADGVQPRAYAVGAGTAIGTVAGGLVGGVAGIALFGYGFHLCLESCPPPTPLQSAALYASPFVAAAAVVAGAAGGATAGASVVDGDTGVALLAGSGAGVFAVGGSLLTALGVIALRVPDPVGYGLLALGAGASVAVGAIGAQEAYESFAPGM